MASETKRIGPGYARDVYPKVKLAVMDGWMIYGSSGVVRIGCDGDEVEVYLVREAVPKPSKNLLPVHDLEGREA